MSRVFAQLGAELGMTVGEFWVPCDDGFNLKRLNLWTSDQKHRVEVEGALSEARFQGGVGIIGQAFQGRRATWITNLSESEVFVRRDEVRRLRLFTAVAFPVQAGKEIQGVAVCFSPRRLFVDESFLEELDAIGAAIGDFVVAQQASQKAQKLAAIVESSRDAIVTCDLGGEITGWLGGATEQYGYSAEEVLGTSVESLLPPDSIEIFRDLMHRVRNEEAPQPVRLRRLCKNSTVVDVSVRVCAIHDESGRIVGVTSMERDIREQKAIEAKLFEAAQQKDEFLAMLGHELRNPLGAIRTAAELLKLKSHDVSVVERVEAIIARQSGHMAKLLDGLLDVSRIVRGKVELELKFVDVAQVCRDVVADSVGRAKASNITLLCDVPSTPVSVYADPTRLHQILDNLLSNALKFTDAGGVIRLSVEYDEKWVKIQVVDTGVGIDANLLPNIFEIFRQSRQSLDRAKGGLGLGLALVRLLLDLHGGKVYAHSDGIGKGATLTVELPRSNVTLSATSTTSAPPLKPRRILIIEDNKDAALSLREVLEVAGHTAFVVEHGHDGIETARREKPDVVICDLGLPGGVTGFDVALTLRALPELSDMKLVAWSGYGRPEDRKKALDSGFHGYLTKPANLEQIATILHALEV
ncbi:MAG: ATP-binding protein [Myxococcota bacterium]